MSDEKKQLSAFEDFIGSQIVVDTDSTYIYIGNLDAVKSDCLVMSHVDVHDTAETRSTKEFYAHETKQVGTRKNRTLTFVRMARVVSVCRLDDVLTF